MPTILDTSGIATATVSYGKESSFAGKLADVSIRVTPKALGVEQLRLNWAATGDMFSSFEDSTSGGEGAPGIIVLPQTGQDGFRHGTTTFKDWYYEAVVTANLADGQALSRTYRFQIAAGTTTLDLDTFDEDGIVTAMPSVAPLAAVTSVNGQTGDVTVAGGGASDSDIAALVEEPSSATAAALAATYATKDEVAAAGGGIEVTQAAAAATWGPIAHSFGRRPSVTVYDTTGAEIVPDIAASTTSVSLTFATPTAGSAVLT